MSSVERPRSGLPRWDVSAPEHLSPSTTPVADAEAAAVVNLSDALVLKEGPAFLVSFQDGTIPAHGVHPLGLYLDDCRHLSAHEVRVAGARPRLLVASAATGADGVHELTNPDLVLADGEVLPLQTLQLRLERALRPGGRLEERIHVHLYGRRALDLDVELEVAADFRPMLAVRGIVAVPVADVAREPIDGGIRFHAVTSDGVTRSTTVTAHPAPSEVDARTLRFRLRLQPGGQHDVHLVYELGTEGPGAPGSRPRPPARTPEPASADEWLARRTRVIADDELFNRVLERSLLDLRMLRSPLDGGGYYAAGVPWFATLFGRDSLITAMEMLAFDPSM